MELKHWIATVLGVGVFMVTLSAVWADDDGGLWSNGKKGADVAPVTDTLYLEECGACHFPYQPGLLPAKSWETMMAGLEDHFGDNAELLPEDQQAITTFLAENAADRSGYRRSIKIVRSLGGAAPLRITEVGYIRREHDEIPARLVADNPEVNSLSRCEACHLRAAEGYYNDSSVNIPGYGKWDD